VISLASADTTKPGMTITSTSGVSGFSSSDSSLNLVFTASEKVGLKRTYSLSELLSVATSTSSKMLCGECNVTVTSEGHLLFDKHTTDRSTCQLDIELPFYFNGIVNENKIITQVIYDPVTTGNSAEPNYWDQNLKVEPNTEYTFTYDVLLDDLGQSEEYVVEVDVNGIRYGEGDKDCGGGGDYWCSFHSCGKTGTATSDENGNIYVKAKYKGNSHDCDCDKSVVEGHCVKEDTGSDSTRHYVMVKAALRFRLTKVNPTPSSFTITNVNGAQNNYVADSPVQSVGEMCEHVSESNGLAMLGTANGLLINTGTDDSAADFDTTEISVPGSSFTSTNILRFGFSQKGEGEGDFKVTDVSLTLNIQDTFSLKDILAISKSTTTTEYCGKCEVFMDDLEDTGYEYIGKGTCRNANDQSPSINTGASVTVVSPQACYDACVTEYGTGKCLGFDTRDGCQIYSFSDAVERAPNTITKADGRSGYGNCYAAKVEYGSIHFDKKLVHRTTCQYDIQLPFHYDGVVSYSREFSDSITQVVYDPTPNVANDVWTAYLHGLEPNTKYSFVYEILQSGGYMTQIEVGKEIFVNDDCSYTDGDDCNWYECTSDKEQVIESDVNGLVLVRPRFTDNSIKCDCDHSVEEGNCIQKSTTGGSDKIWIPAKAAVRFTLTKKVVSFFQITDMNGAEDNVAGTVQNVNDMCNDIYDRSWAGVTLFGTDSKLLVNTGANLQEGFTNHAKQVPDERFHSTNILRFGFSQHGQSNIAEDVKVSYASFTFDIVVASSSFDLSDIQVTGGGEITSMSYASDRTIFNAIFTPESSGSETKRFQVLANSFVDDSGNENTATSEFVWNYVDQTPPTMSIISSQGNSGFTSSDSTLSLTFKSSESTSNFAFGDVSVSGGSLSSFSGSDTSYSASFTPDSFDGVKSIVVPANTFSDASGNMNSENSDNKFVWNYVTTKDVYDVAYRRIAKNSQCVNTNNQQPVTQTVASVTDVSPKACYDACIKTYGIGNCGGFMTGPECTIYKYTHTDAIVNGVNCDTQSNCGDCYAVTSVSTPDTHLWVRGTVSDYTMENHLGENTLANAIRACLDDTSCEYILDHGCDHTLFQDDTAFGAIKVSDTESQDNNGKIYSESTSRYWRLVTSSDVSDLRLYPNDEWKNFTRSNIPHCVLQKPTHAPHITVSSFGHDSGFTSDDTTLNLIFTTNTNETSLSIDDISVCFEFNTPPPFSLSLSL